MAATMTEPNSSTSALRLATMASTTSGWLENQVIIAARAAWRGPVRSMGILASRVGAGMRPAHTEARGYEGARAIRSVRRLTWAVSCRIYPRELDGGAGFGISHALDA